MEWNADLLVSLSGVAFSLVFAYFPKVREWFDGLDKGYKPLINLGSILLVAVIRLVWLCEADLTCMEAQLPLVFESFVSALVANITTYNFAVKPFKK